MDGCHGTPHCNNRQNQKKQRPEATDPKQSWKEQMVSQFTKIKQCSHIFQIFQIKSDAASLTHNTMASNYIRKAQKKHMLDRLVSYIEVANRAGPLSLNNVVHKQRYLALE
jgi:hypothetical protein